VVIKICDFSFAVEIDPKKGEKLLLGSPLYTAPEVINKVSYDSRCDVWSLGVMTYMMLTGRAPFSGTKSSIYRSVLND
jgi:serine/threonine protein kinase